MSVAELSRVTRIPLASLEAIESDRFDELPGEVFVRGFLKAYAQAVGLEPADVLARYTSSRRIAFVTPLPVQTPLQAARARHAVRALVPRGGDQVCRLAHGVSRLESEALVVRTVEYGEGDVIATFVTEQVGLVGAIVRGGRRPSARVGGALEPMHTIAVHMEDKGKDLATLKEARVVRVRARLVQDLASLEAAGEALRWARYLFPPRTPEPEGWRVLVDLLDALDRPEALPTGELARAGLLLLAAVGYGLDFDRCVVCGKACPEDRVACIDPARGGLVCRACGGARDVVLPHVRGAAKALVEGRVGQGAGEADTLLALIRRALAVHAGYDG
jgi:DNA repair protein RecO (recombination protein O)